MNPHKTQSIPKAAQDVRRLVEKISGKSVEQGVTERLVDFAYEYVAELLSDARQISQYLGKKEIDAEDVRLAKEMADKEVNYGPRPSKQVLLNIAQKVNEIPLPAVKSTIFGLRLPPDRFCMTTANYQTIDVANNFSHVQNGSK
ncbi:hypothetical protein RvY_08105 [Ramazzottius varieornatus]|uniref:Transcription initiation factor TFIID subunit 12 domain-containing protein n=1 Tax=Ramazzottius varieornatus TaxID=947166 RepID=A0A1D1VAE8_RAMVA|nr:hypothetical protein RvY_08105 [Ramazzottius varieornatus]